MALILLVEDDRGLREALMDTLEDEGYDVLAAENADVALGLAQEHPIDLVLTDVRMPYVDGFEGLERITSHRPGVKGIVMTGYADEDAPSRAVALAEIWDYIYKPVRQNELLAAVARVLQASQTAQKVSQMRPASTEGPLEGVRSEILRQFYVGVRSKGLRDAEASTIWRLFESLEKSHGEGQKNLLPLYQGLLKLLVEQVAEPSRGRDKQMQGFLKHIQAGDVSPQELSLAYTVRTMDPAKRQASPDLQNLYERLW